MIVYYWLILAAICIVLEVMTQGLTSIWFAGAAVITAGCAALHFSTFAQIVVFMLFSVLFFVPTRGLAKHMIERKTEKTNVESMIGQTCIVSKDIDNLAGQGQVVFKGMEWTARSVYDEWKLTKGTKVRITEISGVKVIVEPME